MQLADREQFVAQLAELCAGFNVPVTDARSEAYWRGLQRMELPMFARCVEYAIGQSGPEKFPTTGALWGIYRNLRRWRPPAAAAREEEAPKVDDFTAFANRRLIKFLMARGAVADVSIAAMVAVKNRLAESYREIDQSERVTEQDFARSLEVEFARLWLERTPEEIAADRIRICRERNWRMPEDGA